MKILLGKRFSEVGPIGTPLRHQRVGRMWLLIYMYVSHIGVHEICFEILTHTFVPTFSGTLCITSQSFPYFTKAIETLITFLSKVWSISNKHSSLTFDDFPISSADTIPSILGLNCGKFNLSSSIFENLIFFSFD